jgi:CDP-diacylglycerol---glycerol-3-phosphate 3-phosphatidyltransferase
MMIESKMRKNFTIPNILTVFRLICSPLFLPFLIVYLLPLNIFWINASIACLFALLSLTDFFDGVLARALKQESVLGQMLDPIADKFLLYATLVSLLAAGKIYFYWVIIFIGREFFMMGLRQIALEHTLVIKVSMLGKIKTALQMVTLFIIILNPYQFFDLRGNATLWNGAELLMLSITTFVSLYSAKQYYQSFVLLFKQKAV